MSSIRDIVLSFLSRVVAVAVPAGLAGGALAGAFVGLAEAIWVTMHIVSPNEFQLFLWGPIVYAVLFSGCGLFFSASVCSTAYVLGYRPSVERLFFLAAGGALASGLLVIGRWRYARDVLEGGVPTIFESVTLALTALFIGLIVERAGAWLVRRIPLNRYTRNAIVIVPLLCVFGIGAGLSTWLADAPMVSDFDAHKHTKETGLPTTTSEHAPNIIFIVVDTLRADALSCYSAHAATSTENFDQLAHDGILFSSCIAASAWTKPSFATLFTGLRPDTHGTLVAGTKLPESAVTIAELLQNAGYYTQGFANNGHITAMHGFGRGFSRYIYLQPRNLLWSKPSSRLLSLFELVRRIYAWFIVQDIEIEFFYQPAEIVNKAVLEWLDGTNRPEDAPFFLFLQYMDPHDPFMDPENPGEGYARINLGWDPPKEYLQPMRRAYDYGIQYTDAYLGKLLEGLRKRALYDDAIIITTSDHGEEFYEHGGWWHGQTLFPEVLHVPLIIKNPGNKHARAVEDGLVRHVDIAPTILGMLGLEQPKAMVGSALLHEDGAPRKFSAEFAYASNLTEVCRMRSIQTPDYKLHKVDHHVRREMAPVKLYDLRSDPLEKKNLAGQGLPEEERLLTLLNELVEEMQITDLK